MCVLFGLQSGGLMSPSSIGSCMVTCNMQPAIRLGTRHAQVNSVQNCDSSASRTAIGLFMYVSLLFLLSRSRLFHIAVFGCGLSPGTNPQHCQREKLLTWTSILVLSKHAVRRPSSAACLVACCWASRRSPSAFFLAALCSCTQHTPRPQLATDSNTISL